MKKKPIDLMRLYFGEKNEICGTCCNLITFRRNGKNFRKCRAYGGYHSSKADWAKRWGACGLHGKEVPQPIVSDTAKQIFGRCGIADYGPIDGQIEMEALKDEKG